MRISECKTIEDIRLFARSSELFWIPGDRGTLVEVSIKNPGMVFSLCVNSTGAVWKVGLFGTYAEEIWNDYEQAKEERLAMYIEYLKKADFGWAKAAREEAERLLQGIQYTKEHVKPVMVRRFRPQDIDSFSYTLRFRKRDELMDILSELRAKAGGYEGKPLPVPRDALYGSIMDVACGLFPPSETAFGRLKEWLKKRDR